MKLNLNFFEADLRKMAGPAINSLYPLHLALTGKAILEIQLLKNILIDGSVSTVVKNFSFDNQRPRSHPPLRNLLAIPQLTLDGKFKLDESGFHFFETVVKVKDILLKAKGDVTSKTGFNIDVDGYIDAEEIKKLSIFDIKGKGHLHWTITGIKPNIIFAFEGDLKDAYYLNLNLGSVQGKVVYNDGNDTLTFQNLRATQGRSQLTANGSLSVAEDEKIDMTIQMPKANITDLSIIFSTFIKQNVPWYPYELTGEISGPIKISGKTDLNYLAIEGDLDLQNVDYHHEIFRSIKTHAGFRRGAYVAENIVARKKNGLVKGNFNYSKDSVISYELKTENFSTYDFDTLAGIGLVYRAPIGFESRGNGKLENLKSTTRLEVGEGQIKSFSVAPSEVKMLTENGWIKADLNIFDKQLYVSLNYSDNANNRSTFKAVAQDFNFNPILISLNGELIKDSSLYSKMNASADFSFSSNWLTKLSGKLEFNEYELRKKDYRLFLNKAASIQVENGNYNFSNLELKGTNTHLQTTGSVKDGIINYNVTGNFDLSFFEFLVAEISSLKGILKVNTQLYGKANDPQFKSNFSGAGVDLRLRSFEQPFEDLNFNATALNSKLEVQNLNANFAGGTIKAQGYLNAFLFRAPELNFSGDVDNAKVKFFPVAFARVTGKMNVQGNSLPYKVKGKFNVAEALVKENFNLTEGARVLRSSKFLPQKQGAAFEYQLFDLDLYAQADKNIFIKNDLFDAELKAELKVLNSIQTPRLLGQVNVLHGKLLFKDNFFVIQSGNVKFNNPSALDPEFEMAGQTEVKGYKIALVANGLVSDYKLNFQSQPPLSENDIVTLLTLGVTPSDFKALSRENRESYSRDEMYGLIFSQTQINKGLQDKLGVKVSVDQSQAYGPESAFRARSTDLSDNSSPKVVLQKEVVKNLNASFGKTVGVGDNQETNANVEYNLGRKWSLSGIYEDQRGAQARQSRTSVGADVKFKIRFK